MLLMIDGTDGCFVSERHAVMIHFIIYFFILHMTWDWGRSVSDNDNWMEFLRVKLCWWMLNLQQTTYLYNWLDCLETFQLFIKIWCWR